MMNFILIAWFVLSCTNLAAMDFLKKCWFGRDFVSSQDTINVLPRATSDVVLIPKKKVVLGQARSWSVGSAQEAELEMPYASSAPDWSPGFIAVYDDLPDLLAATDPTHIEEEELCRRTSTHLKIWTPEKLMSVHPKKQLNALALLASFPEGYFGTKVEFWKLLVKQLLRRGLPIQQPSLSDSTFGPSAFEFAADNKHEWLLCVFAKFLEEECVICQEHFEHTGGLQMLSCGHYFHKHCLENWLQQKATCPTCRAPITQEQEKK